MAPETYSACVTTPPFRCTAILRSRKANTKSDDPSNEPPSPPPHHTPTPGPRPTAPPPSTAPPPPPPPRPTDLWPQTHRRATKQRPIQPTLHVHPAPNAPRRLGARPPRDLDRRDHVQMPPQPAGPQNRHRRRRRGKTPLQELGRR